MRKRRDERAATKTMITILTVVCVVLIGISVLNESITGPVRSVTGLITTPIQKGISTFGEWLTHVTVNLSDTSSLREENEALQKQVDTLTAENSQLLLNKEELERLRELLALSEQYADYETVGAHVISKDAGNWFSTFTIDKGTNDGIRTDCNVIGGAGLVGIVTQAGPNWATVRSIIDDNSNVSAMISNTSDTCLIEGSLELIDTGAIRLIKLQDDDNKVHVGDKVVTSNISEKYLPGILIGYISELGNDANNLTKSGQITPVVDFRHLQEVLVIKELKDYIASPDTAKTTIVNDVAVEEPDAGDEEEAAEGAGDAGENAGQEE